jgi:23S rRNA (uracil1939-C5)-methyltransferase
MVHSRAAAMADRSQDLFVEIASLGPRGDGIANSRAGRLYVAGALPGESVRVTTGGKRGEGFVATLREIVTASPDRVAPPCPHFGAGDGTCGGCSVQHLADGAYAAWKRGLVASSLERVGLDPSVVTPLVRTAPDGRRRAGFAAFRPRSKGSHTFFGFHARASGRVVEITDCRILRPELAALVPALRDLFAGLVPPGARWDAAVTLADNGADLLISAGHRPNADAAMALAGFAEAAGIARISWRADGEVEPVALRETPVLTVSSVPVALPPGAFLQASAEAEAALAGLVLGGAGQLGKGGRIADLYCGVGTFALPLAKGGANVTAIDGDAPSVAALARAAGTAGFGGNVTTEVRDLARRPLLADDLKRFDCVVFDPPRAGAAAQAETLAASNVARVVAVSCNPATFARDAAILAAGGYALEAVTPVDQFVWSGHVELVGVFSRA